jgi:hypothetical protein
MDFLSGKPRQMAIYADLCYERRGATITASLTQDERAASFHQSGNFMPDAGSADNKMVMTPLTTLGVSSR